MPIEVVPFAYAKVLQNLHHILGSPNATLRMAIKKGSGTSILRWEIANDTFHLAGPVVSDNGNFIIDAPFGREHMVDPYVVRTTWASKGGSFALILTVDHGAD